MERGYGTLKDNSQKVVLLIDYDNLRLCAERDAPRRGLDLAAVIRLAQRHGTLVVARAYSEWNLPAERMAVYNAGIDPVFTPVHRVGPSGEGKSLADTALVADGVDLLWTIAPQVLVLATSDKDLIPLVRTARQRGVHVVVIGSDLTALQLRDLADEWVPYRQLAEEATVLEIAAQFRRGAAPAPAPRERERGRHIRGMPASDRGPSAGEPAPRSGPHPSAPEQPAPSPQPGPAGHPAEPPEAVAGAPAPLAEAAEPVPLAQPAETTVPDTRQSTPGDASRLAASATGLGRRRRRRSGRARARAMAVATGEVAPDVLVDQQHRLSARADGPGETAAESPTEAVEASPAGDETGAPRDSHESWEPLAEPVDRLLATTGPGEEVGREEAGLADAQPARRPARRAPRRRPIRAHSAPVEAEEG